MAFDYSSRLVALPLVRSRVGSAVSGEFNQEILAQILSLNDCVRLVDTQHWARFSI